MDGAVAQRLGERLVDEAMLVEQREPGEARARDGHLEVVAAAGKAIFLAQACGSCHTFKAAGSTAKIGPDLDAAPEADAKKTNTPLADFVRKSIVDPNAYIAPGFQKGLMPASFGQSLKKAQLDALVAFVSGSK